MKFHSKSLKSKSLKVFAVMGCVFVASAVHAEACTYNEALMAFQQGNAVRGQALLSMAAKDGDQRAVALFAELRATFAGDFDAEHMSRSVLAASGSLPQK